MSSVAAPNSGTASLLQFLSGAGSPLTTSVTSSPSVQSAIQDASPVDLAQLSAQAVQLQQADGLFSVSSSADPGVTEDNLLASLSPAPSTASGSSAAPSGSISPSQLASYLSQAQLEQAQTLLGTAGTSVGVLA
jgi:hypothetical protein